MTRKPHRRIEYIFEIHKSRAKEPYHWVCRASNGEIRCTSENYTQKASARQTVKKWIRAMKPGLAKMVDLTNETRRGPRKGA